MAREYAVEFRHKVTGEIKTIVAQGNTKQSAVNHAYWKLRKEAVKTDALSGPDWAYVSVTFKAKEG